ncbi:MAG TPA: hypothetical protein VF026_20375 [Ktedonobacteraceae bacterium]
MRFPYGLLVNGVYEKVVGVRAEGRWRADQSAVIGINLSREVRQEAGPSVGARAVDEGLGGPLWSPAGGWDRVPPGWEPGERDAGDHEGPPQRPSSALAPTEEPPPFCEIDVYEGRSIGRVHDKSAPTADLLG